MISIPMIVGIDIRISSGSTGFISICSLLDSLLVIFVFLSARAYDTFIPVNTYHIAVLEF